ncbi:MAG TPA: glycine cleavage system protein GcvH [Deltaproteobacteria bacterium]|nr:glycine cleavage system protein GcvH [Deltaproteobacteria bacterium]
MKIPEGLNYTQDHEWGKIDNRTMRIGITDYAQGELGDIVFVEFMEKGTQVAKGESFGTVESVKAVSEIYAPVSGTILEVNETLAETPELVNQDCYGDAWMVVIEMEDPSEADSLMDAEAYAEFLSAEAK